LNSGTAEYLQVKVLHTQALMQSLKSLLQSPKCQYGTQTWTNETECSIIKNWAKWIKMSLWL